MALTVRQLVDQLLAFPLNTEVWTEGCDCNGEADSVEMCTPDPDDGLPYIIIRRPER